METTGHNMKGVAMDTEGGHVIVSVSLMRNGYEYGTVPDRCGTIHTESGHVVNSVP